MPTCQMLTFPVIQLSFGPTRPNSANALEIAPTLCHLHLMKVRKPCLPYCSGNMTCSGGMTLPLSVAGDAKEGASGEHHVAAGHTHRAPGAAHDVVIAKPYPAADEEKRRGSFHFDYCGEVDGFKATSLGARRHRDVRWRLHRVGWGSVRACVRDLAALERGG